MAVGSLAHVTFAERFFPAQVRVLIPAGGWGAQLGVICGWLDAHIGDGNYCIATDRTRGPE